MTPTLKIAIAAVLIPSAVFGGMKLENFKHRQNIEQIRGESTQIANNWVKERDKCIDQSLKVEPGADRKPVLELCTQVADWKILGSHK